MWSRWHEKFPHTICTTICCTILIPNRRVFLKNWDSSSCLPIRDFTDDKPFLAISRLEKFLEFQILIIFYTIFTYHWRIKKKISNMMKCCKWKWKYQLCRHIKRPGRSPRYLKAAAFPIPKKRLQLEGHMIMPI